MQEAKVENMETQSNLPAKASDVEQLPALEVEMYKMEVQAEHVRKYFAPKDATTADIGFFIAMANSLGLNPWKRELHLVPFYSRDGGRKYAAVVGYEVYLNRAEASGKLDGWEYEYDDDHNPTKCTLTIYRKDWTHPFTNTVYMDEVMRLKKDGKPMALWATNAKFMLLKCTITRSFRFCLPESCAALPYTPEEQGMIDNDERQYQHPTTQLSEATVTGASAVDIDYLRGQYFKFGKPVWADDDARHEWNVANGFKESVTEWEVRDFERAIDILDPDIGQYYEPPSEEEAARMEAELGKDDATEVDTADEDGAQGTSEPDGGADPAMDSAEALQGEIQTRLDRISELLPTSISGYDTPAFRTWAWGLLDDDLKGTAICELGVLNLDILIGAMEAREDKQADDAADDNGLFQEV